MGDGRLTTLLDVSEVARRLHVSRAQVYRMCGLGTLPTVRIGKTVRVPADALQEWIERCTLAARA